MDDWDEGMEYLEEYGDAEAEAMEDAAAGAQGENDADAAINEALDVVALDRESRDNGERPVDEWERYDYRNLLRHNPQLRGLNTVELDALFLMPTRTVGGVLYCRRCNVRDVRKRRSGGEKPFYELAITPAAAYAAGHAYPGAFQWLEDEKKKLDGIWQNL